MGRLRKRHNWKARLVEDNNHKVKQKHEANKSDIATSSLTVENDLVYGNALNGSNVLALPSRKADKETRNFHPPTERKRLSKKARKRLEKIVEAKKKKSKRADVLKLLAQSSVSEHEISQYNSASRLGQVNNNDSKIKLSEEVEEIQTLVKRGRMKGKND